MRCAFIFPGTGSQFIGMGKELYQSYPAVRRVFEEASDILGFSVHELCFDGPESLLMSTKGAQLAIITCAIAAWRVLLEAGIQPEVVAGMSLTQYVALIAANAIDFSSALQLSCFRSQLMDSLASGRLLALVGLNLEKVEQIRQQAEAETGGVLDIALYNTPKQIVLSGSTEAVMEAANLAKQAKAWKIIIPQVHVPCHSRLLRGSEEALRQKLVDVVINEPQLPVILNTTAKPATTIDEIRQELSVMCVAPVRWNQTIDWMKNSGIRIFIQVGAGETLARLNSHIDPALVTYTTNKAGDIDRIISTWSKHVAKKKGEGEIKSNVI
jgi:[acyl-carrier-protein] S-malonyltransferase